MLILAFGLLNIPSLKPTGYIFAKTYRAISKIQSVNVTGSARLVDEDGDDESMDYEFNYNNNAFRWESEIVIQNEKIMIGI